MSPGRGRALCGAGVKVEWIRNVEVEWITYFMFNRRRTQHCSKTNTSHKKFTVTLNAVAIETADAAAVEVAFGVVTC